MQIKLSLIRDGVLMLYSPIQVVVAMECVLCPFFLSYKIKPYVYVLFCPLKQFRAKKIETTTHLNFLVHRTSRLRKLCERDASLSTCLLERELFDLPQNVM